MKKRFAKLALSLLIIVNVSALLTFAYHRWVREPGGPPASSSVLADTFKRQLCLDGRQEKCIQDFRCAFDSEIRDIRARMQEKRRAMVKELKKGSPDGPTLNKLIEDMSRLQTEIQRKAVENLLKEKEVLTDEQKAKFFRLFEDQVCPREKGADRGSAAAGHSGCPNILER